MKIKFPYGTTAENNALTLPVGLMSIDITKKAIRLHDGVTQGGFEMVGTQAFIPTPGETWVLRDTGYGTTSGVSKIAYGNGIWVAALFNGALMRSADGLVWTNPGKSIGASSCNDLIFANGQFWGIGGSGVVCSFTDPNNTINSISTGLPAVPLLDIAYANSMFIVVGINGAIATSATGATGTWTVRTMPNSTWYLHTPTFGNGTWVVGTQGGIINVSTNNGVSWTAQDSGIGAEVTAVAYGNGTWVIVAGTTIRYSTNLTSWTTRAISGITTIMKIFYGSGVFMANTTDAKVITSPDGNVWTTYPIGISHATNYLSYAGGKFFVGGSLGRFAANL